MKRVHYFQRFSKQEDVVTNNTLLLMSRIQHQDALLFQSIVQELLSDEDLTIGAVFTQQASTTHSIADGVIRQASLHVVIETKRGASFSADQLGRHMDAFQGCTSDCEVLLLLGTQEPAHIEDAAQVIAKFNGEHHKSVRLCWTTFQRLIEMCRDAVPEHERDTIEMIDDYEDFCEGEHLLARSDADLMIVGCSLSMRDNMDLRLYYDHKRSHRPAKFIGFYQDKAVKAIGTLQHIVRADLRDGTLEAIS